MPDLNVRPETHKFLEENIRQKLHASDFGNDCLARTPKDTNNKQEK